MKFDPDAPAYPCKMTEYDDRHGDYTVRRIGFTKRERLIALAMVAQIKSTGGFDPANLVMQVDLLIAELNK